MKKKYHVEVTLQLIVEATDEEEAFALAYRQVAENVSTLVEDFEIQDSIEEAN